MVQSVYFRSRWLLPRVRTPHWVCHFLKIGTFFYQGRHSNHIMHTFGCLITLKPVCIYATRHVLHTHLVLRTHMWCSWGRRVHGESDEWTDRSDVCSYWGLGAVRTDGYRRMNDLRVDSRSQVGRQRLGYNPL